MFQFLIGAMKVVCAIKFTKSVDVFQFLIGAMKDHIQDDVLNHLNEFQFLIGAMKVPVNAQNSVKASCFNSL